MIGSADVTRLVSSIKEFKQSIDRMVDILKHTNAQLRDLNLKLDEQRKPRMAITNNYECKKEHIDGS